MFKVKKTSSIFFRVLPTSIYGSSKVFKLKKTQNSRKPQNSRKSSNAKKDKLYNVEIPIYWGGPVNKNKIFILHSNEYKSETTKKYNSISISSDYETLLEIAENKGPEKKLIILGISSWGGGQLEGEMERDHWILSEINTDLIFDRDNLKKWINALNSGFVRL